MQLIVYMFINIFIKGDHSPSLRRSIVLKSVIDFLSAKLVKKNWYD